MHVRGQRRLHHGPAVRQWHVRVQLDLVREWLLLRFHVSGGRELCHVSVLPSDLHQAHGLLFQQLPEWQV